MGALAFLPDEDLNDRCVDIFFAEFGGVDGLGLFASSPWLLFRALLVACEDNKSYQSSIEKSHVPEKQQ